MCVCMCVSPHEESLMRQNVLNKIRGVLKCRHTHIYTNTEKQWPQRDVAKYFYVHIVYIDIGLGNIHEHWTVIISKVDWGRVVVQEEQETPHNNKGIKHENRRKKKKPHTAKSRQETGHL